MLRCGDSIRLTEQERKTLDIVAGGAGLPAPTTVQDLNQVLDNAAAFHDQEDSAEDKLLAAIARDLKVSE